MYTFMQSSHKYCTQTQSLTLRYTNILRINTSHMIYTQINTVCTQTQFHIYTNSHILHKLTKHIHIQTCTHSNTHKLAQTYKQYIYTQIHAHTNLQKCIHRTHPYMHSHTLQTHIHTYRFSCKLTSQTHVHTYTQAPRVIHT